MKKMLMLILALAMLRLLPRAVRREIKALGTAMALVQVVLGMASGTPNTSMAYNTGQRTTALENRLGTVQSQQGTTGGGFTGTASNLSQTETGSPQVGGATIQTGNPNGATISGSSVAAHTHGYGHFHFTQVAADYNNFVAAYNSTLGQLNTMKSALQAANIL